MPASLTHLFMRLERMLKSSAEFSVMDVYVYVIVR